MPFDANRCYLALADQAPNCRLGENVHSCDTWRTKDLFGGFLHWTLCSPPWWVLSIACVRIHCICIRLYLLYCFIWWDGYHLC